uniref:uncharacterized protein LOC109952866 isoform X2 n=1 Tax=Monopterus albus TaxID=43700 RepID=UPI0009B47C25|nr:uncharacterized protein LOC109952866 isoform X2 [Monopterus albus]
MDEITQEDIGPQTERELTSPSSSKPKTVCTVTNNHSEKSSTSDCASDKASSPEQSSDITEPLEADSSNCKEHLSSPHLGCHRDTTTDDADEECRLEMCEGVPMDCCTAAGSCDGEQEVPLGSHMCPETSVKAAEKHREPQEMEQRRKLWSPSFMCLPFVEQQTHVLPEQPKRLEPLRTCTRPIRVGLSKRAKTKHLHCPHPYK